jgi:phytoene dehydrogenase-like protein
VLVVGGGIAGLAAAVYLARAGRSVTLFERRRLLGGRAVTHLRKGFRFNLGPHAVFRAGASSTVYRELGIPLRGGSVPIRGAAIVDGGLHTLPTGPLSGLLTSLLSAKGKLEAAKFDLSVGRIRPEQFSAMTEREWLDTNIDDPGFRRVLESFIRLSTYSDSPDEQSAEVALRQLKIARRGVIYLHEGWQKIVDSLHSHAVTAGVTFVTSSRAVRVEVDGHVRGIALGELELDDRQDTVSLALPDLTEGSEGTMIPADTVLLAVDPSTAAELAGDGIVGKGFEPVTMATLDVALSRLPVAKRTFAVGIDQPLYFSVHSRWAQLTPKGGSLIHVSKFRRKGDVAEERELESMHDNVQPGWRDELVHPPFIPSLLV